MGVVARASTTIAVAIASASDCVVTILLAAETRKHDTWINTLLNKDAFPYVRKRKYIRKCGLRQFTRYKIQETLFYVGLCT